MAEVKVISRNNSNSFVVNDASLADLFSLEITEESSPKSDFDISFLLCGNLEKQCFNKDNKQKKSDDNKVRLLVEDDIDVPSSTEKTAVNSNMSLCALAKNHIESNKALNGWHLDTDFNLTDLLCNGDGFTSVKDEDLCNVNVFNADSTNRAIPNGLPTIEYDACDCDVSELVSESSHELNFRPASSVSLDILAASHVLNSSNGNSKSNSDKKFTDSFMFDLKADDSDVFQFDSFADILCEKKEGSVNNSKESDSLSELSSLASSETSKEKRELSDETSDDDIDLSFCIKKSVKDKYSEEKKSSPDSADSGFDETDFTPEQFTSDASHKSFMKSDIFGKYTTWDINGKEKLIRSKQSLLSKAISARPKIDSDKRAKLKKIRCELLKNQLLPFSLNNKEEQHEEHDSIMNNSDSCIITSNFLTISGH